MQGKWDRTKHLAALGTEGAKPGNCATSANLGTRNYNCRSKIGSTPGADWPIHRSGCEQYESKAVCFRAQSDEGTMLKRSETLPVFLACGVTDMRKSINGLSAIIQNSFNLDPFEKVLFVFCNRQRNRLKILTWEDNGFWLHFKRLERGHFKWPTVGESHTMTLSIDELWNLIQSPGIEQKLRRTEVLKSR